LARKRRELPCDKCGATDQRLHRMYGQEDDAVYDIYCDICYEELTGLEPVCEDFCGLHVDHRGLCQEK
jgi:hypothetical protein